MTDGGVAIHYLHRRRRGQKNIYLRILSDGTVILSSPWLTPQAEIEKFLKEKVEWIHRKLAQRITHSRQNPTIWSKDCRLWYLGKRYPVIKVEARRNALRFEKGSFLFHCADRAKFEEAQHRFYRRVAEGFIVPRVSEWSVAMGLSPESVSFRRYKSRWGCCTHDDRLTFNTALMRYDEELIDYVIVHELAHIRHKNHGREFWRLVERHIPDWRSRRKRLV